MYSGMSEFYDLGDYLGVVKGDRESKSGQGTFV
jgi:hypothetical protein